MGESSAAAIRRTAMDLLARREHSRRELQQKLAQRFSDNMLIQSELDKLCAERLQSDERFAEAYLHSREQRLYGPIRIKAELRERGIADAVIAKVFCDAAIDWRANLRKLETEKFGRKPPADLKEKAKRIRFFQYRGFTGIAVGAND
jgi:regulatory protein